MSDSVVRLSPAAPQWDAGRRLASTGASRAGQAPDRLFRADGRQPMTGTYNSATIAKQIRRCSAVWAGRVALGCGGDRQSDGQARKGGDW